MYQHIKIPPNGEKVRISAAEIVVPPNPYILYIEGDGIGPDISKAMKRVVDAAVSKAYGTTRRIVWVEIFAGDKAKALYGEMLPQETVDAIKEFSVAIKGPLTTPIGGGFRSLNVTLRQLLDLYQCVRPCRDYGAPSPIKHPEKVNIVVFRENTEDVYAGIEYKSGTPEANKLEAFLRDELKAKIFPGSGIGIKPISEMRSKRLVRAAIKYAIKYGYSTVTLVHKGNIQKFTEGAFRDWGYQVAKDEFGDRVISWKDVQDLHGGKVPDGKILINDIIADSAFQQILTRSADYGVMATTNLNGDYLSDAIAAEVGGLGMAPGANIGDTAAVFEATHGTAPKYANQDKINPSSLILSAVMMLEYLGWVEAGQLIKTALKKTIENKQVTYDLARLFENPVEPIPTSGFATAIIENM
jgi:isocitrate dehydrogenase